MKLTSILIRAQKDQPSKLFNYFFWNLLFAYLPIGIVIALLSLFGTIPVTINEEPRTGIIGFLFMMLYILFFPFVMGGVLWLFFKIGNFFLYLTINFFK